MNLPVDFEKLTGKSATPGGYPYQIKAADLQKNFVYAALDVDDTLVEDKTLSGGYTARRLKIPALPNSSEKVALTATGSKMEWDASIPDGKSPGQFLKWNAVAQSWTPFSGGAAGAFPQWSVDGWNDAGAGNAAGQFLRWNSTSQKWEPFSGTEGAIAKWSNGEGWTAFTPGADNTVLKSIGGSISWGQDEIGDILPTGSPGALLYFTSGAWVALAPGPANTFLKSSGGGVGWAPPDPVGGEALPVKPATGTHILGCVNGTLQWLATEEC